MAVNLIEIAKGFLTPEVISNVSTQLGENEASVAKSFDGALPAVLSGLLSKFSSSEGGASLLSLFTQHNAGSLLDNAGSVFSGDSSQNNIGKSLIDNIFGDKIGLIAKGMNQFSGIREGAATSLLGMAASLVMGVVGKQFSGGNFSLSGIKDLLMGQKDNISAALPTGLASIPGLGNLSGSSFTAPNPVNTFANSQTQPAAPIQAGRSIPGWVIPLILVVVGGLAAIFFAKGCQDGKNNQALRNDSIVPQDDQKDTITRMPEVPAMPESIKVKLADGKEIDAFKGSLEDEIVRFIEDKNAPMDKNKWYDFAQTLQFETGKSTLKPTPEAETQLANVVAILAAYPKVKLKIGGYTDNTGDSTANVKLSQARAETVMKELLKRSVKKEQLTGAEGYGPQHPVADNNTEAGKALNRRVSVSVRDK
jgi:OmpA-OmpF porin, OOP family